MTVDAGKSTVHELHPSQIPGAFETHLIRETPIGLIEFESAPSGFLLKSGELRKADWRAYYHTPIEETKRKRLVSVTTWGDVVHPKNLSYFGEEHGVYGAAEVFRRGQDWSDEHDLLSLVRSQKLGVDAARDRAASRGLDMHAVLESYMLTGTVPNPSDFAPEIVGYYQALSRWLLKADPEPVHVELLVASPDDGYAGRLDLVAKIGGLKCLADLKTQERGQSYRGHHYQLAAYRRGMFKCGDGWPDRSMIVVLAADGGFREIDCQVTDPMLSTALAFYRDAVGIDRACEKANKIEREARRAA
jgi:hypothetical protein